MNSLYDNVKVIDGIEIDKGVMLSQYAVDSYADTYQSWLEYWTLYPDIFLDAIHNDEEDPNFHLLTYQRVFLRAVARYKNVSITASSSFVSFSVNLGSVSTFFVAYFHRTYSFAL